MLSLKEECIWIYERNGLMSWHYRAGTYPVTAALITAVFSAFHETFFPADLLSFEFSLHYTSVSSSFMALPHLVSRCI